MIIAINVFWEEFLNLSGLNSPLSGIRSIMSDQAVVVAGFNNPSILDHGNGVCVHDRGKPVSDHNNGTVMTYALE